MRTALLAHPSPDLYGSDRVLLESARALVADGWRVVVALPGDGPLAGHLRRAGAEVHRVDTVVLRKALLRPTGLAAVLGSALETLPAMVRLVRAVRADVVLVNTVTLPTWLVAARLARRPAVCHVHEAEQLPGPLRLALHAPLLLARRVLVNSRAAGAVVGAAVPSVSGRLRLLYNGVPGPPATAVTPARTGLTGEVRLVLVGRVSPRKGTDVAVRALAELHRRGRPVRLDIVGDVFPGYEWYDDEVRPLVEELGVQDRVRRVPFQDDVWPCFAEADIVLVPSRVEPFGNVAVEAALAGRPVVASSVQGLIEIVEPGRSGLLAPPGDPTALAHAVEVLLDDWPQALQMAATARQQAERRFSPTAYAAGLVDVLSSTALPATLDRGTTDVSEELRRHEE